MKNKPHKLFISHSSKDAEYMKAFVDLLVAIGVHKNQITCTSVRNVIFRLDVTYMTG